MRTAHLASLPRFHPFNYPCPAILGRAFAGANSHRLFT